MTEIRSSNSSSPDEDHSSSTDLDGSGSHLPVMLEDTLSLLVQSEEGKSSGTKVFIDATAGAGGHLAGIIQSTGEESTIIGIDRDPARVAELRAGFGKRVEIVHANFRDLRAILAERGINTVSGGILADLGISSMQVDDPARGFSFQSDGPLDMRMDTTQDTTAEQLINNLSQEQLSDILYRYGEERSSRRIASEIIRHRPIKSTSELADLVSRTLRKSHKRRTRRGTTSGAFRSHKHPATRTFQALRIAVNDELGSLEKFLADAVSVLSGGARLVLISFHSLEDRIVKQFLRHRAQDCECPPGLPVCTCEKQAEMKVLTRKPIVPSEQEVLRNPRSRSAKLRAGEKLY